jgi:hypothetical protein
MTTILILPNITRIFKSVDVENPKTKEITQSVEDVHNDEMMEFIESSGIITEDEMFQSSSDGCYECDESGNTKRNPNKKIIMTTHTLLEQPKTDFNTGELKQLNDTGAIRYTETKTFTATKTGFKAIEELEKHVKENNLIVDASELEAIKSSMVSNTMMDKTIPPVQFEHETESYTQADDFVLHCPVTFQIHKNSEVQQADLDAEFGKTHRDMGNGVTTNYRINGKKCTILVLKHDTTITNTQFNNLAKELQREI